MVVPLAILLKEADKSGSYLFYKKIDIWYWTNVFSQRYDKSVDSQTFSDIKFMKEWFLDDSKIPDFISKFNIEDLDLDIDKQNNAIYKGIINLIILSGAFDFKTGQAPQFDMKRLQDDHIFPKSIYNENSILIRTVITSNQSKFNKIPSKYFNELIEKFGIKKVTEILNKHLISNDSLQDLLSDNIDSFKQKREARIKQEIRKYTSIN